MKKTHKSLLLFIFVLLVLMLSYRLCYSTNWLYVDKTKVSRIYINIDNINIDRNNKIIKVWSKSVSSDSTMYIYNLFNYKNRTFYPLHIATKNHNGSINFNSPTPKYLRTENNIVPDTTIDKILNKVLEIEGIK